MQTLRRDKLMRLAANCRLIAVGSYHFDDMYGESRGVDRPLPVHLCVRRDDGQWDSKTGFYNVLPCDFESNCGRATIGKLGSIHLRVHSNCSHDFREVDSFAPMIEAGCAPGFIADLIRLALAYRKPLGWIWKQWQAYAESSRAGDQCAILSEFERWHLREPAATVPA